MKALKNPTPINVRPDAIAVKCPTALVHIPITQAADFSGIYVMSHESVDQRSASQTIFKTKFLPGDHWQDIPAERFSWMNFPENKRRWEAAEDDPGEFYIRNQKATDEAIQSTVRRIKDILEEHKDWKIISNVC